MRHLSISAIDIIGKMLLVGHWMSIEEKRIVRKMLLVKI